MGNLVQELKLGFNYKENNKRKSLKERKKEQNYATICIEVYEPMAIPVSFEYSYKIRPHVHVVFLEVGIFIYKLLVRVYMSSKIINTDN